MIVAVGVLVGTGIGGFLYWMGRLLGKITSKVDDHNHPSSDAKDCEDAKERLKKLQRVLLQLDAAREKLKSKQMKAIVALSVASAAAIAAAIAAAAGGWVPFVGQALIAVAILAAEAVVFAAGYLDTINTQIDEGNRFLHYIIQMEGECTE